MRSNHLRLHLGKAKSPPSPVQTIGFETEPKTYGIWKTCFLPDRVYAVRSVNFNHQASWQSPQVAPSQRLFVHSYAVTSYASQAKTADTVIVADAGNRAATNRQQWYVCISRGRRRVVVLTPNESELRENIQRSGKRELALEESPPPAQTQCEVMAWRMRRQQAQRYAMMQQELV
jgi:hypothetical protein